MDIYTLGEEVLREKAQPVKKFDSALAILVDAMFDTMQEGDGIGLAGPQIGVSQRIFVVDTRHPNERMAFINPEILETSHEQGSYEEGCLSIPGMYYDIVRPLSITVQAQDVTGKTFTLQASGIFARVIQHEYDHLNGVLFIDRMEKDARDSLIASYEKRRKKRK
ncbi:MAG: peptide deformylase [Spirochaetae bacterium HGW-Spirochaetae-8]|nr:MAG: peptide deformylase [Spirochaetae bacterium HGW-Spirochaetae-8]